MKAMTKKSMHLMVGTALLGLTLLAPAAHAQEEKAEGPFSFSGYVSGVSDYRFRGVSLSSENPAAQAGFDLGYALNDTFSLFAGNFTSTLFKDSPTGDVEVDLYTGVGIKFGTGDLKLGIVGYIYPDARNADYYELYGTLTQGLGPVSLTAGFAYAPSQRNFGDEDAIYLNTALSYAIPNTPATLSVGFGYEDNAFFNDKIDYTVGISANFDRFNLGVQFIDTDTSGDDADATVVATFKVNF
jgi:uncharacterized protein (TIGR02001 family)